MPCSISKSPPLVIWAGSINTTTVHWGIVARQKKGVMKRIIWKRLYISCSSSGRTRTGRYLTNFPSHVYLELPQDTQYIFHFCNHNTLQVIFCICSIVYEFSAQKFHFPFSAFLVEWRSSKVILFLISEMFCSLHVFWQLHFLHKMDLKKQVTVICLLPAIIIMVQPWADRWKLLRV